MDETFKEFEFNHPIYILYSSGTTGYPKCIVHGAGNALIEQMKELSLHCDVKENDKTKEFHDDWLDDVELACCRSCLQI